MNLGFQNKVEMTEKFSVRGVTLVGFSLDYWHFVSEVVKMIDDCWCSLSKKVVYKKSHKHWREKPQPQSIHTVKCNASLQYHLLLVDADSRHRHASLVYKLFGWGAVPTCWREARPPWMSPGRTFVKKALLSARSPATGRGWSGTARPTRPPYSQKIFDGTEKIFE